MPQILFPTAAEFSLHPDSVYLFAISLENAKKQEITFTPLLSGDEREKASTFRFGIHRARYVVGRGALRILLGRFLQTSPSQLRFRYGEHGKPELAEDSQLHFNLSHSDELAIYAFTLQRKIGVDVEAMHLLPDLFDVAALYFSKTEIATLRNLPPDKQPAAFFNCWTRKEAYLKAHGGGINDRLREITVTLKQDAPARLVDVAYDSAAVHRWEIAAFTPAVGYTGAVTVEQTDTGWSLHQNQFVLPENLTDI